MQIRIRGPAGQATIKLPDTATVSDLQAQIVEKTSIHDFDVRYGYPPKPLPLQDYGPDRKLSETGLVLHGEQLIVSPTAEAARSVAAESVPAKETSSFDSLAGNGTPSLGHAPSKPLSLNRKAQFTDTDVPEIPLHSHASTVVLRIMPDDNSCLFRAFSTAFFGTGIDSMHELRSIVAQYIQNHPETYSAVVLEKQPDDYCKWIQTEDAWGGAIELDILSRNFDIEVISIDVQTLRTDRFNEGRLQRCILVYSGIHYDTIALSPSEEYAPPDFDTKIFEASDAAILRGALDICRALQSKHYYTDTAAFNVRCNICGAVSRGEKGATEHAKQVRDSARFNAFFAELNPSSLDRPLRFRRGLNHRLVSKS